MVVNSHTVVLERNQRFEHGFKTEPYEVGWALEARWFITIMDGGADIEVTPQVSPDGLHWTDHEAASISFEGTGIHTFPLRDMGAWTRLRCEITGEPGWLKVHIHLQLKG